MTMQQQAINNTEQKKKKPLQQHDLPRHSHQAVCSSYPNPKSALSCVTPAASAVPLIKRKTADPPSTSSPPPTTPSLPSKPLLKKKLLKVILKVPHSSPSSSTPSSSPPPVSRSSPRSSPLSQHPSSPPSARTCTPPPPFSYHLPPLPHPPKPSSEVQKFQQLHSPRPSKSPLQPPFPQIKHPPADIKQPLPHLRKNSPHLSQVRQKEDCPSPKSPSAQQESLTRQQIHAQIPLNISQSRPQQEHFSCKPQHRPNQVDRVCSKHSDYENHESRAHSSSSKWLDQAGQANLARIKSVEQHDDTNPSRFTCTEEEDEAYSGSSMGTKQAEEAKNCRFKRIEQIDQADSSIRKLTVTLDQTKSRSRKQIPQVSELDQAHRSCSNRTEQVHASPSHAKRPETWQLDEEAISNRHQGRQELKDVQYLGSHPKRLRILQQGQLKQTNQGLESPNILQQRLRQIPTQQQTAKKPTQIPVQAAHGLHQSPTKLPSVPMQASSPRLLLSSPSASLQSSAPSLSTSAFSDEAQKPSKKRKLRSLLEREVKHGLSVADEGGEEHLQNTPLTPAVTLSDNSPSVNLHDENQDFEDRAAVSSSSKTIVYNPQLVPAKKLLTGILDRLQKKDKFGVFAEPVDENEVPNYYDIIKNPMDFGTVRTRISSGHYISLELFQKDVFLICDNAMKYNAKGTVYFRHARVIKDIAERILEDLKVSGLNMEVDEYMAKQKSVATGRPIEKHDPYMNTGSPNEIRADNGDDYSGYVLRSGGLIDGRRSSGMDENRRMTYLPGSAPFQGNDPLLTTISGEYSQLIPTGYQMDFPYAKSLARFATDLGPAVWKIAAEMMRRALPPGYAFGPGWVGEREASVGPPSKQQLQGQPSNQPDPKLHNDSGAITTIHSLGARPKPESHAQAGQSHDGMVSKLDHHPSMQAAMPVSGKAPSPMVFGNALVHNERPIRLEQQALAQPAMDMLHTSGTPMAPIQVSPRAEQARMAKPDQSNGVVDNTAVISRSKSSRQVNLNHPISFQADEGDANEDPALHRNNVMKGKDGTESKVNAFLLGPSNPVTPMSNVGYLPYEGNGIKGSASTSRAAPVLDMANSIKAGHGINGGEASFGGSSISGRSHFESRPSPHLSRLNSLNESPSEGASSANRGKTNAFHQYDSSRGSLLPHNLNLPLEEPSSTGRVHSQDANLHDLTQLNSSHSHSHSHSSQGEPLARNLNLPAQQALSKQSPAFPNNHGRPCDTSPLEAGLQKQAPPCPEKAVGERFREAGDCRDRELSSSVCSTPTGLMTSKKGFIPERAFILQQYESTRNGQVSNHDIVKTSSQSLDQLNRWQNPSAELSVSGLPAGLPNSNGGLKVREESRLFSAPWVLAQQPDSIAVSGKGGMMHSQSMRSPVDQQEGTPGNAGKPQNMRRVSMQQLQGVQNAPVFGYGNQKQVSSIPHFLQQRIGHDAHLPIQHQQMQMQLHLQGNSMKSGAQMQLHLQGSSMKLNAQNSVASEPQDPMKARQFQIASHQAPGFVQAGNSGWQSVHPKMGSQGLHQPYTAAPDLNVSLPLTKSSFDQPNGNDIQQPDLALQL